MQTAVEWLFHKLSTCTSEEMVGNINNWFEQAKQMEQLQMLEEWRRGFTEAKDLALNHFDEVIKQVKSDVQSI